MSDKEMDELVERAEDAVYDYSPTLEAYLNAVCDRFGKEPNLELFQKIEGILIHFLVE